MAETVSKPRHGLFKDITGQRFGRLFVLEEAGRGHSGGVTWRCRCECGATTVVCGSSLRSGVTRSCGCRCRGPHKRGPVKDIAGQRFGRLVVVAESGRINKQAAWLCQCDCGGSTVIPGGKLRNGHTKSCGCLSREVASSRMVTHGLTRSGEHHPLHNTWCKMRSRCHNPESPYWRYYGARGISVCDRWLLGEDGKSGFECFVSDMGEKPSPKHSIDRIDNDGNYEPGNCRWATPKQQVNNRRPRSEWTKAA